MRPSQALDLHRARIRQIAQLLGLEIDVLTPNALPDKFRARVLNEARPV